MTAALRRRHRSSLPPGSAQEHVRRRRPELCVSSLRIAMPCKELCQGFPDVGFGVNGDGVIK
jgi:hypothetical protein